MEDRDLLLAAMILMALAAIMVSIWGCTVTTECVDYGPAGVP